MLKPLNISNLDSAIGQFIDGKIPGFKMDLVFFKPVNAKEVITIVSVWNYDKSDGNARIYFHYEKRDQREKQYVNVLNGTAKACIDEKILHIVTSQFRLGYGAFKYEFFEFTE